MCASAVPRCHVAPRGPALNSHTPPDLLHRTPRSFSDGMGTTDTWTIVCGRKLSWTADKLPANVLFWPSFCGVHGAQSTIRGVGVASVCHTVAPSLPATSDVYLCYRARPHICFLVDVRIALFGPLPDLICDLMWDMPTAQMVSRYPASHGDHMRSRACRKRLCCASHRLHAAGIRCRRACRTVPTLLVRHL